MTDQRSYEDGRANRPMAPGTDQHDYNRGQQDREAAMGHNINATSEADNKQKTDWSTFFGPKVEVPGVAYTLILVSPFLFLVYPVLGLTIWAAIAATLGAMALFPEEYFGWLMFIGFILGVCSFFPGLVLEAKASQLRIYQYFRTFWRIFIFLIGPVILLSIQDHRTIGPQTVTNASGEGIFIAIIITIIVHFVMRTLDRLYFPNWKEVKKILAMTEKGEPLKRNILKRLFYGFLWIVPVVCVLNLVIRFIVGIFLDKGGIASFYKDYSVYVYVFEAVIWYFLCLTGILPGTAKTRKSFIDHSKLMEAAPIILIACLVTSFINATPAAAQQLTASQRAEYQAALANARDVRMERWKTLRDPLIETKRKLFDQLRAEYDAKIQSTEIVAERKAYLREMYIEAKRIRADIQAELDKALATVNNLYYNDVVKICNHYGVPVPKQMARFKK